MTFPLYLDFAQGIPYDRIETLHSLGVYLWISPNLGRTLYIADFDAKNRTITNAKPFANKDGKRVWFAYPRSSKDESLIVYQAGGKLYSYKPDGDSTRKVSTNDKADYR